MTLCICTRGYLSYYCNDAQGRQDTSLSKFNVAKVFEVTKKYAFLLKKCSSVLSKKTSIRQQVLLGGNIDKGILPSKV